jgi:serine/threonine protein phosphatase 1
MRTLAIGDIHGSCRALETLAAYVDFAADDVIVALGDYVDRGPDSKGVIDFFIELKKSHTVVTLKGNHEAMMEAARYSDQELYFWLANGGEETMSSFGLSNPEMIAVEIPAVYWDFIASCERFYETDSHILVHAGLDPDTELEDQDDNHLFWQRVFDTKAHKSGKTIVCGHTSQREGYPLVLDHAVCIDTSACRNGWLTCLDIDTGECWQANEQGETRKLSI